MDKNRIISIISVVILFTSCGTRKDEYDPYALSGNSNEDAQKSYFEVDFKKTESNLKTVHVKLNGTNGYDAIFDTGCSGMLISSVEFLTLIKSGTITENDYIGKATISIADGTEVEHPMYNIREVRVMDKNGKEHVVRDITATVIKNPVAEVLIGAAVIDNLANKSYTVDLKKDVIRFD
ncbi:MAG: retroviral-like aspartic protease family protein [Prevotellaceae bacterium]|nr:retroviral-like aspartic protease family protein [Prevotellaceae bacterium]